MNQIHVVPADGNWAVKVDGDDTVLHTASTQAEATDWARAYAQDNGMELAIHAESGEIRQKDSSGEGVDDPNAPDHT